MLVSTQDRFYNAINQSKIEDAETIFAYSDVRHSLILQSVNNCERSSIVLTLESFSSSGLRKQALMIWEECSLQYRR